MGLEEEEEGKDDLSLQRGTSVKMEGREGGREGEREGGKGEMKEEVADDGI